MAAVLVITHLGSHRNSLFATIVAVSLAALLPWRTHADLPVHCLRHQIVGEWEFTIGRAGPKRTSCDHQKPDSPLNQPDVKAFFERADTTTRRFTLMDPDKVRADDGSDGSWTMIYDEGFEVLTSEYVFFAFSRFEYMPDGHGGTTNVSHCGQTQVGWFRNTARNSFGCYVGRQVVAASTSLPNLEASAAAAANSLSQSPQPTHQLAVSGLLSSKVKAATSWPVDTVRKEVTVRNEDTVRKEDAVISDVPSEYTPWVPASEGYDKPMRARFRQSVAEALNFLELGWTASAYHAKFEGKSPRQLNRLAGVRRGKVRPNRTEAAAAAAARAGRKDTQRPPSFLGVGSRGARRRSRDSDESFDWRKTAQNWLVPVVQQGDCGSCYTVSTIHMLTARNRIRLNEPSAPSFSVSFPLYCSEYNQGCDGGYGFLQSKWAEDIGLVPESCAPFSEGGGSCEVTPACDPGSGARRYYRATNHRYVGGFYGGSDEAAIRQELTSNGPMVLSFEPQEDFMYYKSGVYRSGPHKIHQEWEQVDHAVLLVGYGVADGKPHWTLQNSWGDDWGEEGFFRMARGIDESGCESIAEAADVVEDTENPVLDDFIASL
eukprot:TRINITY_DN8699_c0_g1_i2.p1 TRINITY_DN8699_c0_g1~~TRINITY_DN8699_c0_g1_i2.p1  ORF type:complete len:601 (-),score=91.27 TRINITY_DN8699_c0_g1_i2:97-1899(-)